MSRKAAQAALEAIVPADTVEAAHRAAALAWVRSGADIWRVAKPATPPKHLVSYFVVVDPAAGKVLLVDHLNAGLWLPTGGHVEPGEDPLATVYREAAEELGIDAALLEGLPSNPLFVTETTTGGRDAGHVDVSLWYVCRADWTAPITPDPAEFRSARWWDLDELADADPAGLDPHLGRFVAKLDAYMLPSDG